MLNSRPYWVLVQRFKQKKAKELKESDTNRVRTNVDVGIEQIIDMEESADEQHDLEDSKKKDRMERGRQTESRTSAQDCYGDNGENTEEKVCGGAEGSKEMQNKWDWNGQVSKT